MSNDMPPVLIANRSQKRRVGEISTYQVPICGWSCGMTFNSELWTSILPLFLMKSSFHKFVHEGAHA
jgi:hypothetical protein